MEGLEVPKLTDAEIDEYLKNPDVQRSLSRVEEDAKAKGILNQIFPREEDLVAVIKSENQRHIKLNNRHIMTGYLRNVIKFINKTKYVIIAHRDTMEEILERQENPDIFRRGSCVYSIRPETDIIMLLSDNATWQIDKGIDHIKKLNEELAVKYEVHLECSDMTKLTDQEKSTFWREFYEAQCQTSRDLVLMSGDLA